MNTIIKDKLIEPFLIEIDESNFTVVLEYTMKSGKSEGKTVHNAQGYFSTLGGALSKIAKDKTIMNNEDKKISIRKFINEYKQMLESFTEKIKI